MAKATKIVFLGASSASFGLSMLRDLFGTPELRGSTLVMVGLDAAMLGKMTELAKLLNARTGADFIIEQTTDRRAALDGAGFVVNATAIDRNRLWKLDFEVPKKYGIRHTLGENGGPGGLFFTLRTLPLVFDFVRDIEELCPDALFLNFSNPESRIVLALGRYTKVRCIGLCHGIFMGRDAVADIMGLPRERVEVWGAGLNHFQCLLQIRDRITGEDLVSEAARGGTALRSERVALHPATISRFRVLADLQRRPPRRVSGLRLGGGGERLRLRPGRTLARRVSRAARRRARRDDGDPALVDRALRRARRGGDRRDAARSEAPDRIRHRHEPRDRSPICPPNSRSKCRSRSTPPACIRCRSVRCPIRSPS